VIPTWNIDPNELDRYADCVFGSSRYCKGPHGHGSSLLGLQQLLWNLIQNGVLD
jgi:hypothetical protein